MLILEFLLNIYKDITEDLYIIVGKSQNAN